MLGEGNFGGCTYPIIFFSFKWYFGINVYLSKMKRLLISLLFVCIIQSLYAQKNNKKAEDPRMILIVKKDSVWGCFAKTGNTEYIRGGTLHKDPNCSALKECTAEIRKVKYEETRNKFRSRRCEICTRPN